MDQGQEVRLSDGTGTRTVSDSELPLYDSDKKLIIAKSTEFTVGAGVDSGGHYSIIVTNSR